MGIIKKSKPYKTMKSFTIAALIAVYAAAGGPDGEDCTLMDKDKQADYLKDNSAEEIKPINFREALGKITGRSNYGAEDKSYGLGASSYGVASKSYGVADKSYGAVGYGATGYGAKSYGGYGNGYDNYGYGNGYDNYGYGSNDLGYGQGQVGYGHGHSHGHGYDNYGIGKVGAGA